MLTRAVPADHAAQVAAAMQLIAELVGTARMDEWLAEGQRLALLPVSAGGAGGARPGLKALDRAAEKNVIDIRRSARDPKQ